MPQRRSAIERVLSCCLSREGTTASPVYFDDCPFHHAQLSGVVLVHLGSSYEGGLLGCGLTRLLLASGILMQWVEMVNEVRPFAARLSCHSEALLID